MEDVPLPNRVDPFGDLHAVPERGTLTGNRGCLVDDAGRFVRHHRGALWIACRTRFRGRRVGLTRPRRWTPLFFLDDAVALAAGHRPCGECRHAAYLAYRDAASAAAGTPLRAGDLNRRLAAERLRPGRGWARAGDRPTWAGSDLPDGTVVLTGGDGPRSTGVPGTGAVPRLVLGDRLWAFSFAGWRDPVPRPPGPLSVLTPPTSVAALRNGFVPAMLVTPEPGPGTRTLSG
jgi:hypothetical protein